MRLSPYFRLIKLNKWLLQLHQLFNRRRNKEERNLKQKFTKKWQNFKKSTKVFFSSSTTRSYNATLLFCSTFSVLILMSSTTFEENLLVAQPSLFFAYSIPSFSLFSVSFLIIIFLFSFVIPFRLWVILQITISSCTGIIPKYKTWVSG
jgi:hypothetical protein